MISTNFEWQNRIKILRYRCYEEQLQSVWKVLQEKDLKVILFKGWAAAQNYPQPFERNLGDIDLAVAPEDFAETVRFLKRRQINNVDLHRGLRHLDTLLFAKLWENSKFEKTAETRIRVLCPEDHLRVLSVHWLNDGGVDKHKLWDIYHLLSRHKKDFDWEKCLGVVDAQRRRWIVCAIAIVHRYLNLEIYDTPLADEINQSDFLPEWLIRTIEKEWENPVRLKPLTVAWKNSKDLKQQLQRRFPPNPIQASIETDAPLDDSSRVPYQAINFVSRMIDSINRSMKKSSSLCF